MRWVGVMVPLGFGYPGQWGAPLHAFARG